MTAPPTPQQKCSRCLGKGIYSEWMSIGIVVPVLTGKSDKPLPCPVCGSDGSEHKKKRK